MSELSPRLRALADTVLPGRVFADIGTDHAFLPAALLQTGKVERAIASDIGEGPLRAARRNAGHLAMLSFRRGDGLAPLQPGEANAVAIAGMGGRRIVRILQNTPNVVTALEQLVLQPNTDWGFVRKHIAAQRWSLHDERLVEDGGHFYLILDVRISGSANAQASWTGEDFEYGPLLRRRLDPVFMRWLAHRRAELERAREKLQPFVHEQPQRAAALERALRVLEQVAAGQPRCEIDNG